MKRNRELKNDFFHIGMSSENGIQKTRDQNYGIFIMVDITMVNILEYFHRVIGQRWMYGNIF
jgi:hypothetical protein